MSTQTLPIGTILNGKYRIDDVLGQGGFGITYGATQTLLGLKVAIKEMFPSGTLRQGATVHPPTTFGGQEWQQAKEGFTAEAKALGRFNHPDIVRVLDLFEEGGTAYMVMERLSGETLQDLLNQRGSLPPAEVRAIALRVAQALQLVHDAGLLHRDIKPDNIFLETSGRVVLIDFGAARTFESGKTVQHTRMVTPGYAPMEQYGSAMKFGPYTDIYALGATLYHALTGKMPPAAPDLLQGTPLPPLPTSTPADLQRVVTWAMSPKISDRPQHSSDIVRLLTPTATPQPIPHAPAPPQPVPTPAPNPTPVPNAPPASRKMPLWPLIVLAALGYGAYNHFSGKGQVAPPPAQAATPAQPSPAQDSPADINAPADAAASSDSGVTVTGKTSAAEAAPLMITDPAPYTTLPPGQFELRGSGQPGDVVDIAEDDTSLGRIQIGNDGGWTFTVPGPTPGPHLYKVSGSDGATLGNLTLNIARPEASVPPAEQIADEEVDTLVDQYVQYGSGDDIGPAMALYTDQVDYFTRGMQPKSVLYDDKRNYFKRWTQRSYQRTTPVTTLSSQGNTRQVRFDYRYDIANAAKELSGTAYTVLDLVKLNGSLRIAGEKGAIYPETQTKRILTPAGQAPPPPDQRPTQTTTSGNAPRFASWHFGACRDDASGLMQSGLSRGRLQNCPLVIQTIPNGASPVQAVFNYELEYIDAFGSVQKFAIDAPDHWPPAPDQPTTVFRQDGDNLIFILPLIVKDRPDRQYNSINVTGTITFNNGSTKNVYEKLPVGE